MKKIFLFTILAFINLSAMSVKYEIPVLDTVSGKAVIDISFYGKPFYFYNVPERSIRSFLRVLAHERFLPWLSDNPAYVFEFDTLSNFKTWSNYSGLQNMDGGWAKCRIEYRLKKGLSPFSSTNQRYRPGSEVVIGIFSGRESYSKIKRDVLYRTDVVFAKKIGYYLNREVSVVIFNKKLKCLQRLSEGKIDLAIVREPIDRPFSRKIDRSKVYFETGAVFCSQNLPTVKMVSKTLEKPAVPNIEFCAIQGSRAYEQLRLMVGEALVKGFPSILSVRQAIHDQEQNIDNAFIPEVEACADHGLVVLETSKKRCWTWRRHIVLGRSKRIIRSVNKVIDRGGIRELYASMCGRSERK